VQAATILGGAGSLYQRQQRRPRQSLSLDDLLPGWQDQADHVAIRRAYQAVLGMSAEEVVAFALR